MKQVFPMWHVCGMYVAWCGKFDRVCGKKTKKNLVAPNT